MEVYHCVLLMFLTLSVFARVGAGEISASSLPRRDVDMETAPESLVWIVQLSDLHFSVFEPERALEFKKLVAPALSMIKPSLVFLTGDLTDGKSQDSRVMKQNEHEWVDYRSTMEDVVMLSGLDTESFHDLRGNHDNFGVPSIDGEYDFFSKYSINGRLGRREKVNSVTLHAGGWTYLFVGFDTTMSAGLRGPTNLFGHPTDELLRQISSSLSQWDHRRLPTLKIALGHFPISFTAASPSGKKLEDTLMQNSVSAYLCGHLHTRFGTNLKRWHGPPSSSNSSGDGFWEWEMGDWRKSRVMRVLAIDRGFISFADVDFRSGRLTSFVLPTFPLDSRFTNPSYKHRVLDSPTCHLIRALVFSDRPVVSVTARVFDSSGSGFLNPVMDTPMAYHDGSSFQYTAVWNFEAFKDPSPERFWLQIEAIDAGGRSTLSEMRPFSMNGVHMKLSWTFKEYLVMCCPWDVLYYPIFWFCICSILSLLLIPKAILTISRKTDNRFLAFSLGPLAGIYSVNELWIPMVGYTFWMVLFPWMSGVIFTGAGVRGYMTYRGWRVVGFYEDDAELGGSPDVMMIVLPHLLIVVFPAYLVCGALVSECRMHISSSEKKDDDGRKRRRGSLGLRSCRRYFRKFLLLISLAILWKHFKSCMDVMSAFAMASLLDLPMYIMCVPMLLGYAINKTIRD